MSRKQPEPREVKKSAKLRPPIWLAVSRYLGLGRGGAGRAPAVGLGSPRDKVWGDVRR